MMKEALLPETRPIAQPKASIAARWVFCFTVITLLLTWVRLLLLALKIQ